MKKNFWFYIVTWGILLAIYNLIVFLVKPVIAGDVTHYDAGFWIAWLVVIATYIGQLFCAKIVFDSENKEKLFLNIPLITQSYAALIIATITGSVLMLIPYCPAWAAAIVCAVVFGFSAIAVIKVKAAADMVSEIDEKIKMQTFFIKELTVDVESLMNRAQNAAIKAEIKKVYEAVRYSDPMSNDRLSDIEKQIAVGFDALKDAVASEEYDSVVKESAYVIVLIGERNKKCKLLK